MTVDLGTRYLGLDLRSPIVASSSPLTGAADTARLVEEAGAAAIVLPSLFEEEIVEIAGAVHDVGGLLYYDGANLNAILGVVRPS